MCKYVCVMCELKREFLIGFQKESMNEWLGCICLNFVPIYLCFGILNSGRFVAGFLTGGGTFSISFCLNSLSDMKFFSFSFGNVFQ